jgi:hypothetical protein
VALGRALGDHQPGRDLLVGQAVGHQAGYLVLPRGQAGLVRSPRGGGPRLLVQGVGDHVVDAERAAAGEGHLIPVPAQVVAGGPLGALVVGNEVLVGFERPAQVLPEHVGRTEQGGGPLGPVGRGLHPGQRLQAPAGAGELAQAAAQPQAFLLQAGGSRQVALAQGQQAEGPQRVGPVEALPRGLGDGQRLLVAGGGPGLVARHAGGHGQDEQQVQAQRQAVPWRQAGQAALAAGDGGGQVVAVHDGGAGDVVAHGAAGRVAQFRGQGAALGEPGGGGLQVAVGQGQPAVHQQGPGPAHRRAAEPGQRLAEPVPPLAPPGPAPPVEVVERDQHAQGRLGRLEPGAALQAVVQGQLDVGVLALQAGEPGHLARADPVGLGPRDQVLVPAQVPFAHHRVLAYLTQFLLAELAHRLQHPVPDGAAVLLPDQDRLAHQRGQHVQQALVGRVAARADGLGGVQLEAAGEHRGAGPEQLLGRGAQVVAPVDAGPQRLLPGGHAPQGGGEQVIPVGQALGDLLRGQRPQPDGGQLDGQRQAVQAVADLHHGVLVADGQLEPG